MNLFDPTSEPPGPAPWESNEPFQLLLETLPYMAFVIWPHGQAAYYNQIFIDFLGFRPGPDISSRTALQHPDDQPLLEAARKAGVAAGREYILETRIRRHDGVWRWHRIHNKPLVQKGKVVAWLGTAVDIHDFRAANEALEQRVREHTASLEIANQQLTAEIQQRRQTEEVLRISEERYRTLYNSTPVSLLSVDSDDRLIDVNDTWLAMFEYAREEAIGRSPAHFMTAESAARYRQASWRETLAGSSKARTVDYQFRTGSGRIFDGRLASRGEFDSDGRFVRSWSAISDVTAEKLADQELRQVLRLEAVAQLTAGMAHDFNNLLTAVLGNLELLGKRLSAAEPPVAALLSGAAAAAQRGATLTAQLLAFARQQRITAHPLDVRQTLERIMPLLRSTVGSRISIETNAEPGLWTALADPTQLELAAMNLVINARDAMPAAGTIAISVMNCSRGEATRPEEPPPGDYVAISVTDTGSGMPEDVRERAFEPFFTTKGPGKGSGLGLSQVLGMTKQLHGGVGIASVPGAGTCVTIFLPRAEEASAGDRETTNGTTPAAASGKTRILVVDDDADVLGVTAAMLRDAGYDVMEAPSGPVALGLLEDRSAADVLLLTDVAMPGMSGVQLASIVRRSWPEVPVLFMTGFADSSLLPPDVNDNVLAKPFQAEDLEARMLRATAGTHAARSATGRS